MSRPGWSADRVALGLGYSASLVILAATFTRSFAATADFAVRVGAARPGLDAWLVPLGVDVAIVAASVLAWASARAGRRNRWAYGLFVFAAATSIALNVAHAPLPGAEAAGRAAVGWARFIAALPPVLLLWTTEVLLRHVADQPAAGSDRPAPPTQPGRPGGPSMGDQLERVWAAVAEHAAGLDRRPSQNAVARALGLPRTTVQRAIHAHRDQWDALTVNPAEPPAADGASWAELEVAGSTAAGGNGSHPTSGGQAGR